MAEGLDLTAFVLGGGGILGAHEVGMLAALEDAGIRPDLVLGTSIGAINGVFVAADPDGAAKRLETVWRSEAVRTAFAIAPPGGTVVLAPACSSFDMFRDYAERGEVFAEEVRRLAEDRRATREQ